jgi:NAD/NADP transhydrogenase alpha subunit
LNVVGGFVVTDRMLHMFKPKPTEKKPAPDTTASSDSGAGGADGGRDTGKPS